MSFSKEFNTTEVELARNSLETAGLIEHGQWVFGGGDEAATYLFLAKASELLKNSTTLKSTLGSPTYQLINRPHHHTASPKPGSNYKIDACLVPLTDGVAPEKLTHAHLAVTAEYKKNVSDRQQNWRQLLSGVIYTKNVDPRRKHMFSFSIEDEEMTLWYFSPSHSCVSPTFNINEQLELSIRIILMFMYASSEELGIDPTVMECNDPERGNQICYVYQVGEKYYKTVRSIFEHSGLCYTGRATRVWEVVEVQDANNLTSISRDHFALKDYWLDDGAPSERTTQEQLFCDIEKGLGRIRELKNTGRSDIPHLEGSPAELLKKVDECISNPTRYKEYFLTIGIDWQGKSVLARASGAKAVSGLFDDLPKELVPATQKGYDQSRSRQNPLAVAPQPFAPPSSSAAPRSFTPKTHHRVVFREVGTALHYVDELKNILEALPDFLFGVGSQ
ncbi:hypothetical protein C8Q76DRAFT_797012 [Earliella scabrosa]|nr:hypothetical protein C8Q76DRAFT_797012 [Earliella scabrosa]